MSFVIVKKGDKKAKYTKNLQTLENELQGLDAYKYCGLIVNRRPSKLSEKDQR